MKVFALSLVALFLVAVSSCSSNVEKISNDVPALSDSAYRDVTPVQAQTAVEKGGIQFIDVRGESEFSVRHAPKSVNIPLAQLESRMVELNPGAPTYVICEVGVRSKSAAETLAKAGFTDVHHVKGGLKEWMSAGLSVETEEKK